MPVGLRAGVRAIGKSIGGIFEPVTVIDKGMSTSRTAVITDLGANAGNQPADGDEFFDGRKFTFFEHVDIDVGAVVRHRNQDYDVQRVAGTLNGSGQRYTTVVFAGK